MNKTIIAIVICLIAALSVVAAAGTVEVAWVNDKFVQGTWSQLHFKVENVDLTNGIAIVPRNKDNEPTFAGRTYKFGSYTSPSSSLFPFNAQGSLLEFGPNQITSSRYPCIDTTTGQMVAYITYNTGTTTFVVEEQDTVTHSNYIVVNLVTLYQQTFGRLTGQGQTLGKFDFKCPVYLSEQTPPLTDNIQLYYRDDTFNVPTPTNYYNSTNITLPYPPGGWVQPHLVFTDLKFQNTINGNPDTSTTVDVFFTTDTLGVHTITSVNGPRFKPYSASTGEAAHFWCSSGTNERAARIFALGNTASVYVTEFPSDTKLGFKCQLFMSDTAAGAFVRSERSSITITRGVSTVARTVDFHLKPGAFTVSASHSGLTSSINISSDDLTFKTATMVTNSTIKYTFGKDIDVSSLSIPTGYNEYRFFQCSGAYNATIHVDKGSNSIIMSDVVRPSGGSPIVSCTFQFSGAEATEPKDKTKNSWVSVSVDGVALVSRYGEGTKASIAFRPSIVISTPTSITTLQDEIYTVVHKFQLDDRYNVVGVSPSDPMMSIRFNGHTTYTAENYAEQMKCQIASPTDSKLIDLTLDFDSGSLVWFTSLKTIIHAEMYSVNVQCTYNIARQLAFGVDVTPRPTFEIRTFDLIDGKRYASTNTRTVSNTPIIATVTTTPTEVPPPPRIQFTSSATVSIPDVSFESVNNAAEWFATTFDRAISETPVTNTTDKYYTNYEIKPSGVVTRTLPSDSSSQYTYPDINAADQYYDSYIIELGYEYMPTSMGSALAIGYAVPLTLPIKQLTTSVSRTYTVRETPPGQPEVNPSTSPLGPALNYFMNYQFDRKAAEQSILPNTNNNAQTLITTSSTRSLANPLPNECGAHAVRFPLDFNYFNASYVYDWEMYRTFTNYTIQRCPAGFKCATGADCDSTYCLAGLCTYIQYNTPKYAAVTDITELFETNMYFNSSSIVSISFAAILTIIAFVF